MRFVIEGNPIPQKRHRTTTIGGYARQYDPQKKEKERIKGIMTSLLKDWWDSDPNQTNKLLIADYYLISFEFYLPYPKRFKLSNMNLNLWGLEPCNSKPDFDNLEKFVCDCANEILIKDDCQIIQGDVKKYYSSIPRTVINIMPKSHINLSPEAEKILSLVSPTEFVELIEVIDELQKCLQDIDDVERVGQEVFAENSEYHRRQLEATAYSLSLMADKFSPMLQKITKKCPEYWKKCKKIEQCCDSYGIGKTLC